MFGNASLYKWIHHSIILNIHLQAVWAREREMSYNIRRQCIRKKGKATLK